MLTDMLAKIIQLKPRFLFGLLIFTLILIFSPESLAKKLGFFNFRDDHRSSIGIGAIALLCMWIVQLIPIMEQLYLPWVKRKKVLSKLYSLTPPESVA